MPIRQVALAAAVLLAGCATAGRFPAREPMWRDGDLDARSVPCRTDGEGRTICRPASYTSSFAWDAADNAVFRPVSRFFAVDPGGEAVNVNSLDEVPDSSWFRNRIGRRPVSRAELFAGSCGDERIDGSEGVWTIDQGKPNGANPGFRVRLPDGRRYMLKADLPDQREKPTAATAIASRLYHAAGWYAPCDSVVYVRPEDLRLTPGLTVTDNLGVTRPFDRAALDRVLGDASWRDGRVRFAASRWLPGRTLGPWRYEGVAPDDPGDVIPHQDRRDLRGARLLAAWLGRWDTREQNSMRVWISEDPANPDGSPGRVLHYLIDLGDAFGTDWSRDDVSRRMGQAYFLDFGYLASDFVTLGLVTRPWHRVVPHHPTFAYYAARGFDPERWVGNYPNPAFQRMTERDGAWAARIIARFDDGLIDEAVRVGDFTNPEDSRYLAAQLRGRRDAILRRYLARLSPIADLRVEGDRLCGVDLARRSGVFAASLFTYDAGGLPVTATAGGRVCVALPAGQGYRTVTVRNGQAPGPLVAHLDDRRLLGLERIAP
jgi:hypothetical protein